MGWLLAIAVLVLVPATAALAGYESGDAHGGRLITAVAMILPPLYFGTILLAWNGVTLGDSDGDYSVTRANVVVIVVGLWILAFAGIGGSGARWPSPLRLGIAALVTVICWYTVTRLEYHAQDTHGASGVLGLFLMLLTPALACLSTLSRSRRVFAYSFGASSIWWLVTIAAIVASQH